MMRSMFSGVSGLRTHQARMDVIGHNIANVNTVGFKSSRMTFADTFSQTLQGASGPNAVTGRGGTNPQQVGLGVNVSSIQRLMTPGGAQRTDDPFHLMIERDGFFVVGDDVGGLFFTRAGDFVRDRDYNIHLNGLRLQGWRADWAMGGPPLVPQPPIQSGPVSGIQIDPSMRVVAPSATGAIEFRGNIQSSSTVEIRPMTFHDSLGQTWSIDLEFRQNPAGSGTWEVRRSNTITQTDARPPVSHFIAPATAASPRFDPTPVRTLQFDSSGLPVIPDPIPAAGNPFIWYFNLAAPAGQVFEFGQVQSPQGPGLAADARSIRIDFSVMTQHSGTTDAQPQDLDGREAGRLVGLSIGPDGVITGTYSNGESFALWQIALANFSNPAGLMAMGTNLFATTPNSGLFDGVGNTPGGLGTRLLGGTLEMSNVDLASEFTEMITTQRGFQANSRVISTSDEILQELVNLRR